MSNVPLNKQIISKSKPEFQDERGYFKKGHHVGRPVGSKSAAIALRDRFIQTIIKLDKVAKYKGDYVFWYAKNHEDKFMSLVASLLPKQLKIESETKHVHIDVMDLPEADRVKILNECRERVRELRGDDAIDVESVNVLGP